MRHYDWSLALLLLLALGSAVAANEIFTPVQVYGEYGQVYPEDEYRVPNPIRSWCNPGQTCPADAQQLPGKLNTPLSVAVGPQGQVMVADTYNHRVQVFGADGAHQLTIGGLGSLGVPSGEVPLLPGYPGDVLNTATNTLEPRFFYPTGVGVDALGKIVVADNWNHRIAIYHADGSLFTVFGEYADITGGALQDALGSFAYPYRVALREGTRLGDPTDTDGRLYVLDQGNHRVQVFTATLVPVAAFGGGSGHAPLDRELMYPNDIEYDTRHEQVLVTDGNHDRVQVFSADGTFRFMFGGSGDLATPLSATVDAQGRIYVSDKADRVRVFAQEGDSVVHLADFAHQGRGQGEILEANGISDDGARRIIIADSDNHRIQIFELPPLDTTPPVSTATLRVAPNLHEWVNVEQGVTFTATDVGDGVDTIVIHRVLAGGPDLHVAPGTELTFPEGVHVIDYYAVDRAGNREAARRLEIRVDMTAPVVTCLATTAVVWPPNHKMVPVSFAVSATDAFSGPTAFVLTSATSSERDSGLGQGDQPHDLQGWQIGTADTAGFVRAERLSKGPGRTYSFVYESRDQAGNAGSCTAATTTVPHAIGK